MTVPAKAQAYDPLAGVRRFALEKIYTHQTMALPNKVSLEPGNYADLLREKLQKLQTYVWGQRDTHVVGRVPATWWDHYKTKHRRRFNPWGWFLRKATTPPAMREVRINVTTWLPELKCEFDGEQMTIVNFDANLLPVWTKEGALIDD